MAAINWQASPVFHVFDNSLNEQVNLNGNVMIHKLINPYIVNAALWIHVWIVIENIRYKDVK